MESPRARYVSIGPAMAGAAKSVTKRAKAAHLLSVLDVIAQPRLLPSRLSQSICGLRGWIVPDGYVAACGGEFDQRSISGGRTGRRTPSLGRADSRARCAPRSGSFTETAMPRVST